MLLICFEYSQASADSPDTSIFTKSLNLKFLLYLLHFLTNWIRLYYKSKIKNIDALATQHTFRLDNFLPLELAVS